MPLLPCEDHAANLERWETYEHKEITGTHKLKSKSHQAFLFTKKDTLVKILSVLVALFLLNSFFFNRVFYHKKNVARFVRGSTLGILSSLELRFVSNRSENYGGFLERLKNKSNN